MLQNAVKTFADELLVISATIKARTVQQIRSTLTKKAYEEAGLPLPAPPQQNQVQAQPQDQGQAGPQAQSSIDSNSSSAAADSDGAAVSVGGEGDTDDPGASVTLPPVSTSSPAPPPAKPNASEVTLNMLNAPTDSEVDVEGLGPPTGHF